MSNEIQVASPAAIEARPVTPMALIERASAAGASIEQMQQLFELKLRVEADEARKAYFKAVTAFKAKTITITRDKENAQYSRKSADGKAEKKAMYVSLGNLIATVTPFLSKHHLSARWDNDQTQAGTIKVTCILSHIMGHSEQVSMIAPPDTSGAKNPIQQIKSTQTYLRACTFEAVCGLASTDANLDDDGNGAGSFVCLDEALVVERVTWIESAKDMPELKKLTTSARDWTIEAKDNGAKKRIQDAYEKRKAELQ